MTWQPIETAPKDGARVLLFRDGWMEDRCVGYWNAAWKAWNVAGGVMSDFVVPTHWMPLPDPPK